ncbi:MAG: alpha/beta hydrolase [Bacteroidia bacterium]
MKSYLFFSITLLFLLSSCGNNLSLSPEANDRFHLEADGAYLPIMVRGNTSSNKILLYIQGGPGLNTLDFAYVDYPNWKNNIEKDYAVAYFDQRGLGNSQGNYSLDDINIDQFLKDIYQIVQLLQHRYPDAEIYLMGHSWGGWMTYLYSYTFRENPLIKGAIALNAPFTTDQNDIRWTFRRDFLLNISEEFIAEGVKVDYWAEVKAWIELHPTLSTPEEQRQWNIYANGGVAEFEAEVQIGVRDYAKVLFGSSYNVFPSLLDINKADSVTRRLFRDARDINALDHLNQITVPILLVTGRYDDIAPPEELVYGIELIGSEVKRLEILPDAGHDSFINQPEMFREILKDFLE